MYYDSDGVEHAEFYRKGQLSSTILTYPDGTEVHNHEETPIRQALKEGQKKAQVRDTVVQQKAIQRSVKGG